MHITEKQEEYLIALMGKKGWLAGDAAIRPGATAVLVEFAAAYGRKRAKTYIRGLSLNDASALIGELKSL